MQINEEVIKAQWNKFKGEVQKTWGDLTGDELEQTKGNLKQIEGLIQQKYAQTKEDVYKKLGGLLNQFSENAKNSVEKSTTESQLKENC